MTQKTQPRELSRFRLPGTAKLAWATAANLAFVLILACLENLVAERQWFSTLLTYAPQAPFVIPTAVLLLLACLKRDRALMGGSVLAGVLALFLLLGFQIPSRLLRSDSDEGVRVMTWNLRQGEFDIRRVVKVIDKHAPDVVCLQEAGDRDKWGDPVQQILWLRPKNWHAARAGGLAILSREPIRSKRIALLPMGGGRAMLAAQTSVHGAPRWICTVHFNSALRGESVRARSGSLAEYARGAARVRLAQTAAIMEFVNGLSGPVILTGDLNSPPRGVWYRRMSLSYQDAFSIAGWGFGYTYSSRLPVLRIDYIFASKAMCVDACFAVRDVASDHRAVVADISNSLHR